MKKCCCSLSEGAASDWNWAGFFLLTKPLTHLWLPKDKERNAWSVPVRSRPIVKICFRGFKVGFYCYNRRKNSLSEVFFLQLFWMKWSTDFLPNVYMLLYETEPKINKHKRSSFKSFGASSWSLTVTKSTNVFVIYSSLFQYEVGMLRG